MKFKPPEYDTPKYIENGPEMWMSEIRYIEKLLDEQVEKYDNLNIVEWGSGRGTVYFAKYLKNKGVNFKWYAIENFLPWHKKVLEMLKEEGLDNEVTCVLKSPTEEPDHVKQELLDYTEYINFPKTLGCKFNFILVDARQRKKCVELAAEIVEPDGVVVMHDAEREENHAPELFLDGGEFAVENVSPNSRGGIQKLWVGRIS